MISTCYPVQIVENHAENYHKKGRVSIAKTRQRPGGFSLEILISVIPRKAGRLTG